MASLEKAGLDLIAAATAGNVAGIQEILALPLHLDVNYAEPAGSAFAGRTALMAAVSANRVAAVRELLHSYILPARLSVDVCGAGGNTALHALCGKTQENVSSMMMSVKPPSPEDRLEILRLLLDANAELDAVNAAGQTPLILACHGGHAGLAHALLTRGANVDAQDHAGRTPLMGACLSAPSQRDATVEVVLACHPNIFAHAAWPHAGGSSSGSAGKKGPTAVDFAVATAHLMIPSDNRTNAHPDLRDRLLREFVAQSHAAGPLHSAASASLSSSEQARRSRFWLPDDTASACLACQAEFGVVRRRHHCRGCGLLLCDECTQRRVVIPATDDAEPRRVCKFCIEAWQL